MKKINKIIMSMVLLVLISAMAMGCTESNTSSNVKTSDNVKISELDVEYSYILMTIDVDEKAFRRTETGNIPLTEYDIDDTLIIGSVEYTTDSNWTKYIDEIYGDGSYECCLKISEQHFPEASNVHLEYCHMALIGSDKLVIQMKGIHELGDSYTIKKYVYEITRNE